MSLDKASSPSRQAVSSDVVQFYRLVHNREPESDGVVEAFVGLDLEVVAAAFFASGEFVDRVIGGAGRGETVWGIDTPPPSQDLIDWSIETLPLSTQGRDAFLAWADSWPGVYFVLLSDPTFKSAIPELEVPAGALARLKGLAGRIASVERIDASIMSGWVMSRGPDAEPAALEVWAGDVFIAAGRADRFRRDVQDMLGGDGLVGFEIRPDLNLRGAGPLRIEVRIALTGERIGEGRIQIASAPPTGLDQLRAEVAAVRATLERLEQTLPVVTSSLGRPMADYGDYFEEWVRRPVVVHGDDLALTVVLDAVGASALALDRSARSIQSQSGSGDRLVMLVDPSLANQAKEIANRGGWRGQGLTSSIVTEETDPGARLREALSAEPGGDVIVLVDADVILSGVALTLVAEAFATSEGLGAVYADEDRLDPEDEGEAGRRRHIDPVLRPGYDDDLLFQLPYVGTTLAFRRSELDALDVHPGCEGLHGCDLVLRLGDRPGAVGHIASVLATRGAARTLDGDGQAWARCVRRESARRGRKVEVEPKVDILGAKIPGAVRIRHAVGDARVSVIIPTRDRMDLLKPCIDSILTHRGANRCALELIIIDHESREPGTRTCLEGLAAAGDAKIVPFQGVFNWALMNNLAAADATGEVLVFLNNDTVVLSPDWLDELASQALRPEVGVVGARLLYADGTIQHAGFVSRDGNKDFLIHDGVGVAGSDGGYLGRHALVHASPVVTGACMAVRTEVFRKLGGFDSANFPLEGNDADLCYRARAEGLSVLYDPWATLYHLESKTRGFSVSGEDRTTSLAAQALLRERWVDRFGKDAGFNPHFDRTGRPFERLRPPSPDFLLA
ncbi:glycosyltransferase family 2 protein [Brevundimonas sp.]|uniref:glycosyltransferase family 2 protein n=1 Tax=Brevundimonas sp. TaxID=1871086 RepID=UPI003D0B33F4